MRPTLLILLTPLTLTAQENFPCSLFLEQHATPACGVTHDAGHALMSLALVGASDAVGVEDETLRYVLATLALPVLQEAWDIARFQWIQGFDGPNWEHKGYDILTYQWPWAVYLAKRDRWYAAQAWTVAYVEFLRWRYYGWGPVRNSAVFHGSLIAVGMGIFEIIEPVNETAHPLIPYVMGNLLLGSREIMQLSHGEGQWGDLLSGLLLPLPAILVEEVLR